MRLSSIHATDPSQRGRTFVFGDIHGDLDIMARSFAEKKLLRYDGDVESLVAAIETHLEAPHVPELESMVIRQSSTVSVVLVGDLVDRYHQAYHVVQFVSKIRWERFGIRLVHLLGNHDLMNLMFFTNPYGIHHLMEGAGSAKHDVMHYVGNMGLAESLRSFYDLHHPEIFRLQSRFYRSGRLEYPAGSYSVVLRYPMKLPWLGKRRAFHEVSSSSGPAPTSEPFVPEELEAYFSGLVDSLEMTSAFRPDGDTPTSANALILNVLELLGHAMKQAGERNWWRIFWKEEEEWYGYSPDINGFNIFTRQIGSGAHQFLPIDWRIISLVWRRHYGDYFRNTRLLHCEGSTLFVHGGISPLAMLDPMLFGNLYIPSLDRFKRVSSLNEVSLQDMTARTNRLVAQIIENALNDYSFRLLTGAEILDQMGLWRGCAEGLPEFGGPLWCDFNFLHRQTEKDETGRLLSLYRDFIEATGLRRVVCGHTYFVSWERPELRCLKSGAFEDIGLEYICVDNGCSRAYRWDEPVPTGIEIDPDGRILGPAETVEKVNNSEESAEEGW